MRRRDRVGRKAGRLPENQLNDVEPGSTEARLVEREHGEGAGGFRRLE